VRLLRGETSRRKTLAVSGLGHDQMAAALGRLIENEP
jgi:uncharacterized protein YggU (UPF0235/DUF167 family)